MRRRTGVGVAALVIRGLTASAFAADDPYEREFVSKYHCLVVAALSDIHATPERDNEQDRFLILDRRDAERAYVQCAFYDHDSKLHCEAASAFYGHPVDAAHLAALEALGFPPDASRGNYVRVLRGADALDFPTVAEFLLRSVYRGYPT